MAERSPSDDAERAKAVRAWLQPEPGRLIGRGHPAGDFLEAYAWRLLEEDEGYLRIRAHVPEAVKNPRGQMFGGFTPTYVDLVALFTVRAGARRTDPRATGWLATTNMRLDYFEPLEGPELEIESRLEKRRGRTRFVATRFLVGDGGEGGERELAVYALTTIREVPLDRSLGDG